MDEKELEYCPECDRAKKYLIWMEVTIGAGGNSADELEFGACSNECLVKQFTDYMQEHDWEIDDDEED